MGIVHEGDADTNALDEDLVDRLPVVIDKPLTAATANMCDDAQLRR
jgi:hypothetical protein